MWQELHPAGRALGGWWRVLRKRGQGA
jgi:hypothetical protein